MALLTCRFSACRASRGSCPPARPAWSARRWPSSLRCLLAPGLEEHAGLALPEETYCPPRDEPGYEDQHDPGRPRRIVPVPDEDQEDDDGEQGEENGTGYPRPVPPPPAGPGYPQRQNNL